MTPRIGGGPARDGGPPAGPSATVLSWPQLGKCSWCHGPAQAFPSGRWAHVGESCPPRSQTVFRVEDLLMRPVFIPDGLDGAVERHPAGSKR